MSGFELNAKNHFAGNDRTPRLSRYAPTQSNEALLLREADMLEFLDMMGMARDFARRPRTVETCYKRILARRADIQGRFTIPRVQEIARFASNECRPVYNG